MKYKKIISFFFVLVMIFEMMISPEIIRAADSDYTYMEISGGMIIITKYLGQEKNITIPTQIDGKSVIAIGDGTFSYCTSIESINVPDTITEIAGNAFLGCTKLTSVTISKSVKIIRDGAFDKCSGLNAIYVDINNANYKSIDGVLFDKNGTTLIRYPIGKTETIYQIPNGVIEIDTAAFYDCTRLESINIPDTVATVGYSAFFDCTSLKDITIPKSVSSLGYGTFDGCNGLNAIYVDTNNVNYKSINGVLFNGNGTTLIRYPMGKTQTVYKTPSDVIKIGEFAFNGCSVLTDITIPDSVTSIEDCAFFNCTDLTSIYIPSSVTSIGEVAFLNDTSLKNCIFEGNAPNQFGEGVFNNCNSDFRIYYKSNSKGFTSPIWNGYNSETIPFKVGDLNGDWIVDYSDYTCLKDYILRKTKSFPTQNSFQDKNPADLDGDGRISSADSSYLTKYLQGKINKFPVEQY
jgi:hypothetical protein